MNRIMSLPRYDASKTYRWNFEQAPEFDHGDSIRETRAPKKQSWSFCGLKCGSPLGVAAGPLLNGKWCLYYADLGFDVVTYKTVRSKSRECYPLPNLLPVQVDQLNGSEETVARADKMSGSWAVSFGMPSSAPDFWRQDVQWTRENLPAEKLLSVSIVGTMQEGWDTSRLGEDYATSSRWAVESGADCIEINFSCPNVSTCDGQLYQNPLDSKAIATAVRDSIGKTPLIIKIGFLESKDSIARFVDAVSPFVDALAMTNSIATKVKSDQEPYDYYFEGQRRGICGDAIRHASVKQTARFRDAIEKRESALQLIGVGGINVASHVRDYLNAGAHACHLATAVMVDPLVGKKIQADLVERELT